ncbi:KH domain-containing, RNA-binding, signal transduction-associated protein 2-like [Amphibalanus amphitrite]|uniref:KH domain-containing, RNA-binding, signal transduction-associated protein 2-like n=1 Tax=Amphibalanus amphitrite TaxID=1232801 RepID=UPI001C91FEEF|nr:KH domain-containing, RNA-binding, signal transduction-associated protein 2-like [Amphibalanus amphitrite]
MAILGRGSMRDKVKEEEMRKSNHPRTAHLHEELHVEIVAFAPPAEAYARMAYALTQVRRYLIPDNNDQIRQEQMREMKRLGLKEDGRQPAGAEHRESVGAEAEETASGSSPGQDAGLHSPEDDPKCSEEPEPAVPVTRPPAPLPSAPPQRQRVLNILDRARLISESSRVAKLTKSVDSRSFTLDGGYELPEAFLAPDGRSPLQWLGLRGPMERRRLRPAPYIIPK